MQRLIKESTENAGIFGFLPSYTCSLSSANAIRLDLQMRRENGGRENGRWRHRSATAPAQHRR